MSFQEVQRLLHLMNVEMEPEYAFQLFQVSLLGKDWQKPAKATVSLDQKYSDPTWQHSFTKFLLYAWALGQAQWEVEAVVLSIQSCQKGDL